MNGRRVQKNCRRAQFSQCEKRHSRFVRDRFLAAFPVREIFFLNRDEPVLVRAKLCGQFFRSVSVESFPDKQMRLESCSPAILISENRVARKWEVLFPIAWQDKRPIVSRQE